MRIKQLKHAGLALFVAIGIIGCQSPKSTESEPLLTQYVNPFIGTGGHGHTFPGATTPFGMIQLSPDTRYDGWDSCSGYHYSDSTINGFSHNHLSGTGCSDLGDVLLMPITGTFDLRPHKDNAQQLSWCSPFSHEKETSTPGYYQVFLDRYSVNAELTASKRVGFHRYTFPKDSAAQVVLDLDWSIQPQKTTRLTLEIVNDHEIRGYKMTNYWAFEQAVYFHAIFSEPFTYQLYRNDSLVSNCNKVEQSGKVLLKFGKLSKPLMAKVALSAVDYEGAKNNLTSEIADWDFDKTRQNAAEAWNDYLKIAEVDENASKEQKEIYYTALYHSGIAPMLFSDADGRYLGMDFKIHTTEKEHPIYTTFSLWDTFRALHPFFSIIQPTRNQEFVRTLISKAKEGGVFPKWELYANYTGCMIGYHAVSLVTDAYAKGMRDFDLQEAYKQALRVSRYDTTGVNTVKPVLAVLIPKARYYKEKMGYIPADKENESVAKALEYAYDDWCIAQLAKAVGDTANQKKYMDYSKAYKNYFDPETGFMRGKDSNGKWHLPFNPQASNHRNDPYCEGTAWQWTWFVPHDVDGLMELMGGKEKFTDKLDALFAADSKLEGENTSADISGLIGQYAHGNEPSHHIVHLYNYAGKSFRTQELLDSIYYSQYSNQIDGLSGNEDCGQMSAWLLMNAMGIYQVAPGNPTYSIGIPYFRQLKIHLENGKTFEVKAPQLSRKNKYVASVKWNGSTLDQPFISHEELMKGGTLEFEMTATPKMTNLK